MKANILTPKLSEERNDSFWYYGKQIAIIPLPDGSYLSAEAEGEQQVQLEENGTVFRNEDAVTEALNLNYTDKDIEKTDEWDGFRFNNWIDIMHFDSDHELIETLEIADNYSDAIYLIEKLGDQLHRRISIDKAKAQKKLEAFVSQIEHQMYGIENLIETLPDKGDKSDVSQKVLLQIKVNELSYAVNGLTWGDFVE